MLEAFHSKEIYGNVPLQIECICTFSDFLLVGTKQGILLLLSFKSTGTEVKTIKLFAKKAITQLAAVTVFSNQLVSLSDGQVTLHDVNTLQSSIQLPGTTVTSGASLFCVHQSTAENEEKSAQLAVACRKKVTLYHWVKKGLPQEMKEVHVYDIPRAMVFSGKGYSDQLYLGFKGKYARLHTTSEQLKELICTGKQLEAALAWIDGNTVGLCKDEWSIFHSEDNSAEARANIKWCDNPTSLLHCKPYVLAVITKGIEVKNINILESIQVLELPRAKFVAQGKRMFVASTTHIWELHLSDPVYQVDTLIKLKQFELAETLNKMTNTEGAGNDPNYMARQRKIDTEAAYYEFTQKRFEKSIARFLKTNVPVDNVVGLFPDLLPQKIQKLQVYPAEVAVCMAHLTQNDKDKGYEALEAYLLDKRRDVTSLERELKNSRDVKIIIDTSLLKCYLQNKPKLVASLLRVENHCHLNACEKALRSKNRMEDLITLYKSKGEHDKALEKLKQLANMQNTQKHDLSGPDPTIRYLRDLGPSLFELVKKYSKWVIEKHPGRCLEIFTAPNTASSLPYRDVVAHLRSINPEIALQYQERLVEVFNVRNTEVETDLLTTLIAKVAEEWPPYNGKLAAGVELPCAPGSEPGHLGELRNKLLHYLEVLLNYKAEQILRRIPHEIPLYHEQAILYCRLGPGDYEKSLALYCHVIKDQEKAEEFCRKYYQFDDKIYYKLLKMYQSPPSLEVLGFDRFKVDEPRADMDAAIEVRVKHFRMIDKQEALALLPPETRLADVNRLFCAILKDTTRNKRQNQMLKSLHLFNNLQVKSQMMSLQSDKFIVNGQDNCSVCNKKVGEAAIAFYPDRRIVHYGCMTQGDAQLARTD